MTEPDLLDRMAESTAWTRTETVDPAADLARGRRRLRIRRTRIGAAAVSAVAVTALGVNALTGSIGTAPAPSPAATPTSARASQLCPAAQVAAPWTWNQEASRLLQVLAKHVDPIAHDLRIKGSKNEYGCTAGYDHKVIGPWIDISTDWRQDDLRVAIVHLQVHQPGNYDQPPGPSYEPQHPHLRACWNPPLLGRIGYTCSWNDFDGRRVLVGSSDADGKKGYLVGYVRPDGQVVTLEVWDPAVKVERLVEAVTDPAMTLR